MKYEINCANYDERCVYHNMLIIHVVILGLTFIIKVSFISVYLFRDNLLRKHFESKYEVENDCKLDGAETFKRHLLIEDPCLLIESS